MSFEPVQALQEAMERTMACGAGSFVSWFRSSLGRRFECFENSRAPRRRAVQELQGIRRLETSRSIVMKRNSLDLFM